jgi:hypothetical protein
VRKVPVDSKVKASSAFRWDLFSLAALALSIYFFFRYLYLAAQILISYGDDAITVVAAPGRYLLRTFPKDFLIGLFSGFRGEDHVWPVIDFYGFLTEMISSDSMFAVVVYSKAAHVLYTLFLCWIVLKFWKSSLKVLLFFILFTFNLNLTWRPMTIVAICFAPFLGSIVMAWIYKMIQAPTLLKRHLTVLFLLSLLMSFSYETAFANLCFLAGFTAWLCFDRFSREEAAKRIFLIGAVLFVSFIPYFISHQYIFGTPIPFFRNVPTVVDGNLVAVRLLNYMKFNFYQPYTRLGVNAYYYMGFVAPFLFMLCGFGSRLSRSLYAGFLLNVVAILFTGRIEHGLWYFSGTILLLVYADILGDVCDRTYQSFGKYFPPKYRATILYGLPIFAIVLLFQDCTRRVDPMKTWSYGLYQIFADEQRAFSEAIGEAPPAFLMFRTTEKVEFPHRDAIWMGNNMMYGGFGLSLVPSAVVFAQVGGGAFFYSKEVKCDFFEKHLSLGGFLKDAPVILRTESAFSRYVPSENMLLRSVVLPQGADKLQSLCIPSLGSAKQSRAMMRIYPKVSSEKISAVNINGTIISTRAQDGFAEAEFKVSSPNVNVLLPPGQPGLRKIEIIPIGWKAPNFHTDEQNLTAVRISAKKDPCKLQLGEWGQELIMILNSGESILYQPPIKPVGGSMAINFSPVRLKKKYIGEQPMTAELLRGQPGSVTPCENYKD